MIGKKILHTLLVCGGLVISTVSMAADEGPHDKQIQARQSIFKLFSYHIGILGAMAKGEMEYNAELATEAAKNLEATSKLGQSTLWPPGSDNGNPENAKTRALPAIWETFPDIVDKAADLEKATTALAAVAGDGVDAIRANIGDVGASCKACHDDFRAKKK